MAHERATRRPARERVLPEKYSWQGLLDANGAELEVRYVVAGREPGQAG